MRASNVPGPARRPDVSLTNGGSDPAAAPHAPEPRDLTLAGWRVLRHQNRLVKGPEEIPLEPKAADVLVALAGAQGATRSRDELMAEVWPNVIVSDDSLHRAVSRLRRSLAPYPELKGAVLTVPKRGYRLDWEGLQAGGDPGGEPDKAAPRPQRKLLAIGAPAAILGAVLAIAGAELQRTDRDLSALQTRPFTGLPGQERAASFAPDGTRAVFAWSGEDGSGWDLYVKGMDEWTPRRLTDLPGGEFNPAWSPDAATIAFARVGPGDACRMMLIDVATGNERFLRHCAAGGDVDLSWSPAGDVLFFTDRVGASGPIAVHRLELASGAEEQVSFPPPDYRGDSLVRVSPDGSRLAVARTRALGVTDIYTLPADGGEARRWTDDELKVHGLGWNRDGSAIYFSSNRGGSFGLWRVEEAGRPQPVTLGGINADSVATSPGGERLIFETERSSSRLWALALEPGQEASPRVLSRASGWHWHPAISPDGKSVAFVSDRSGSPEVWVSSIEGDSPRKLTAFGGPYTQSPSWSPDGRRVLFTTPVGGNFELYTVDVETAELRRLTDHPATDRNPTWSGDGRAVYFASNRTGRWEVWRQPLQDRQPPEQVTRSGGFRALERNGTVLFVKRDLPGLFKLDAGSQDEVRLTTDLLPLDWSNWALADQSVYMVTRLPDVGVRLVRLDLESGELFTLQALDRFPHESGLAIAPDHSAVVFSRTEAVEADLVLLEGFETG